MERTIKEVVESMSEPERHALYYLVGCAVDGKTDNSLERRFATAIYYCMDDEKKTVTEYLIGKALEE